MPQPELGQVDPASEEEALFSRIALSANPRKTEYLGNRACGFSIREACNLSEISVGTLHKWRREDTAFAEFEENIYELQRDIGPDVIRLGFLRCFKMFLNIDHKVLMKASLLGLDIRDGISEGKAIKAGLSTREYDYICKIRKEYVPAALLALHRALEPEALPEDDKGILDRVVVLVDGKFIEGELARAVAGKALLDQCKENKKMLSAPEDGDNGDGSS